MKRDGLRFLQVRSREEADRIQEVLLSTQSEDPLVPLEKIRSVAGLDAAYSGDCSAGAAVVMTFPGLCEIGRASVVQRLEFPYIPGYLAFREGPVVYRALMELECLPDLLLLHGHGSAHPKRLGLATHLGIVSGIPSIGVARHPLAGFTYDTPAATGGITPLMSGKEVVGSVIRRRKAGSLLFVSPGYGMDIAGATSLVMATFAGHALPEPLWCADRVSREALEEYLGSITETTR
jgi:deoxyribonuclease V